MPLQPWLSRLKTGRCLRNKQMDAPGIFSQIDPSRISRSKAEETLLYVRYLLNREQEPAKIKLYQEFKTILEARLKELAGQQEVPPADLNEEKGGGQENEAIGGVEASSN